MSTKRPYSSEGRLALPARPDRGRRRDPGPAQLEVPDDGLAAFGIRRGDRVLLALRQQVEHGDVVAAPDEDGVARLWKAYPARDGLHLARGAARRALPPDAAVEGVVVAVFRPLGGEG